MTQKFLYIVDHYVPFPSSEYGGMWNVIAEDDHECFDLITKYDEEFNVDFYTILSNNIQNARVYALSEEEKVESAVIESFTT